MAELKITKDNFEAEVIQSKEPVLLDFWAVWWWSGLDMWPKGAIRDRPWKRPCHGAAVRHEQTTVQGLNRYHTFDQNMEHDTGKNVTVQKLSEMLQWLCIS